jgi:hypothetical protein
MTMIVYESPEAILEWDEKKSVVVLTWQGAAYGKALRTPIEKLLELVVDKKKKRWVVDLRKIGAVSKNDQEWYDKDFLPRAAKQGVKRVGTMVPKSALAQLTAAKYLADTRQAGIWIKYFSDIDKAKDWIGKV